MRTELTFVTGQYWALRCDRRHTFLESRDEFVAEPFVRFLFESRQWRDAAATGVSPLSAY